MPKKVILKIIVGKKSYKIDLTYFMENWGAPFIITFMILLSSAAIYLTMGNESLANKLAEYAYYALVVGVILQLAAYIKINKN